MYACAPQLVSSSGHIFNFDLNNIQINFFSCWSANFNRPKKKTKKANFHTQSPVVKPSEHILQSWHFSYYFSNGFMGLSLALCGNT